MNQTSAYWKDHQTRQFYNFRPNSQAGAAEARQDLVQNQAKLMDQRRLLPGSTQAKCALCL